MKVSKTRNNSLYVKTHLAIKTDSEKKKILNVNLFRVNVRKVLECIALIVKKGFTSAEI